jgi:RNA polymerase sigma-70 factor (ECF subfamily)
MVDTLAIEQVLGGDKEAYRHLVERYHVGLVRYCYSILLDDAAAHDAAQQAFINAYKNLRSYKPKYAFSTWLYRIARNEAYRELKHLNRRQEITETEDFSDRDMEENLIAQYLGDELHAAMANLRAEWRQILHLYYWEQKSYEEIAELLDKPLNTIKVWMKRAKQQLEKELIPT